MEEIPQGLERFIARQNAKRHLAAPWAKRAGLVPGMATLDFGCGPGILTLEYARILRGGIVVGVERSAAAVGRAPKAENMRFLVQEYDADLAVDFIPDIVFVTDTLHHLADRLTPLRRIRAVCQPRSLVFIAEYDPEGAGAFGAPRHRRMPRAETLALVEAAGFTHAGAADAEDEHYVVIARCPPG